MPDLEQLQLIPADGGVAHAVHFDRVVRLVGVEDTGGELLLTRTATEPGRGSTLHALYYAEL